MSVHVGSKREVAPDFSGYVDEYRFTPLTPSLERALARMVETGSFDRRDPGGGEVTGAGGRVTRRFWPGASPTA